jgi:uncharacterized circularly permuted ATP-grasp superfamily protein/uncharacterized alpha-E superfamily protein
MVSGTKTEGRGPDNSGAATLNRPGSLFASYAYPADVSDELCAAPGKLRPHWNYLASALNELGAGELQRRRNEALRQMRDNDVTFNIYDDPRGMGRPWELDLLPLLISSEEWSGIESGLMQRAELLNLVLRDLYGPRNLLNKGQLPADLVNSHPGFLRPCVGIPLPGPHSLLFYAADLARSPDGRVRVLADRAQAPSGAGYALENRIVVSRVLPSLFRDAHVHRLATFFRTLRQTLNRLSPRPDAEANIVLLTAGPANETYFEHAYLANYLGYTLVEGSDMTVRDGCVWLSTLDGKRQVDVILRRMDDSYCDPVELREDSCLGVPGLLNVVRTGRVGIANPLGTGLLDNPALMKFLPALSRQLLGEDLRIDSVETWWCGDKQDLGHVLANLERLVIKPVHPSVGFRFVFGRDLNKAEIASLSDRIRARPHLFLAQQPVSMSTVPVLADDGLEPRRSVLRSFLVSDEHDYLVMPGGLTRVSADADKLVVSSQAGGISKDTWVLATESERQVSLLQASQPSRGSYEQGGELPARVADNLFWLGRYAERAEFNSRLLRHILQRLVGSENDSPENLSRLLVAVTRQTTTFPGFIARQSPANRPNPEQELLSVISDEQRQGSLTQTVSALLRSARSVRDRLSSDTWRVINDIDEELRSLQRVNADQLMEAWDEIDNLVKAMTAFSGVMTENLTHGRGWLFLDTGRRIERAIQTVTLLRSLLVPASGAQEQVVLLESLLAIVDSLITYRRRYRHGLNVADLLELVVYDERNPRALAYQLSRIEQHINGLPGVANSGSRNDIQRLALEAATQVRLADVRRLAETEADTGQRKLLDQLLATLAQRLPALSEQLSILYFRASTPPHQLLRWRPREAR